MKRALSAKRILGIDPGFGRLGYGIIEEVNGEWQTVVYGLIETSPKNSFVERLMEIRNDLVDIVKKYKPTIAAVEELFFYKNVTTAIEVGQARGVVLLTLAEAGLPIHEFTPLQVKQSLTGYGRAEKSQLQYMVTAILKLKARRLQDDAADALAVALTAGAALPFAEAAGRRKPRPRRPCQP